MSSGGSRGNPGKGGSNKTKPNKSDSKTDKTDLNPKTQIKPTAEQMQLAKIIDSHRSEDPELREKIKQVMEITRASEDEACMALHSREYDTAQAITLLTGGDGSGQNLSSEWEQAGKKKKPKVPAPKNEAPRGKDATRDRSEKRDGRGDRLDKTEKKESDQNDSQNMIGTEQRRGERGERGARGAMRRGGRGRGGITRVENKENDEVNGGRGGGFGGRIANGPGRGGRGAGGRGRGAVSRDGTRTFASRARGGREDDPGSSSIGMWMNSQAEAPAEKPPLKVGEWNGFPAADEWDNEEYTGSLQETKVFTASTQNPVPTTLEHTNGVAPNHLNSAVAPAGVEGKISTGGSGDGLVDPSIVNTLNNVSGGPSNIVPGQSIALSMLLPKAPNASSGAAGNPGANILASLQSSYTTGNQVVVGNTQALPPRHKVQRPQGPVSKIPSSAVEMPVDSVTTLDVKFGGLDFDDSSSLSFGPVMHGGSKPGVDIMYSSAASKIDSFSSTEKDSINSKTAPPQAPSPFQNQRNSQSSLAESGSAAAGVPISPNIDSIAHQGQKSNNSPQSTYANPQGGPSAFANYAKVVPGYTVAPGFAPVSIAAPGTVTYSNSSAGNGSPGVVTATSFTSNSPSNYHAMSNLGYGGNQPVVTAVLTQQISSQPMMAPVSQSPSSYAGSASQPQTGYANAAAPSSYGSAAGGQYGSYGSKIQSSLSSQNVSSGHPGGKDSTNDNTNVSSASASSNLAQIGSMQQNSGIPPSGLPPTSTANPKNSAASNIGGGSNTGAKIGIPPGMVMQPQYILNPQSGVPAFYQLQAPFYGFEENVQLVPRIPPHIPGYYDTSAANYGNPMSFTLEGGAGGPGVSGRNDGTSLPNYSGGTDGRFPRSDSSTASPVPSNIAGQNTQQPMYNPAAMQGYYFVGNNTMMHPGHFQYGPPPTYLHPTSAIVTPTNPSGASHAATSNHQYQKKGGVSVYAQPFSYDGGQQPTEYGKNSYAGGPGQNSNSGKTTSAASTGSSQSTDLNSSMYSKGPLNKMNSYDKPYVNAGGYNSIGAGSNPLNSPLSGAGMGGPQYYIQPDGSNASRQGTGQPQGNKQYGGPPYWTS